MSGSHESVSFIDLFAGCGGLSLGLTRAGWTGLFAVEKNPQAFATLKANLVRSGSNSHYHWPKDWLPVQSHDISELLRLHERELANLSMSVDLVAGGPPCQGFSTAGRRQADDPRNELFREYLHVVQLVKPRFLLFENVRGFSIPFGSEVVVEGEAGAHVHSISASDMLLQDLQKLHYKPFPRIVHACEFGVPQLRPRFVVVAIREDVCERLGEGINPFEELYAARSGFLRKKKLPLDPPVSAGDALSDLSGDVRQRCSDSPRFEEYVYSGPKTEYQRLMHHGVEDDSMDSMRLVKHRPPTTERIASMQRECPHGPTIRKGLLREQYGLKKQCLAILNEHQVAHTLTTLPDDLLHYSEPRILTVRECARLQSFPDWFRFQGNYTTGGKRRTHECPRYTQVGNAVPPLLAEALGDMLLRLAHQDSRLGSPEGGSDGHRQRQPVD